MWPERPASTSGGPSASASVKSVITIAGGIFIGSAMSISGTTTLPIAKVQISYPAAGHRSEDLSQTLTFPDAGIVREGRESWSLDLASSVSWLHDSSGLTWEQLGRALGVSRRAVHLWATGGRINSINAEHLQELVGIVRRVEAKNPDDVRTALLAPRPEGRSFFDDFRTRTQSTRDNVAGTPFAPDQLVGALHDTVQGDA